MALLIWRVENDGVPGVEGKSSAEGKNCRLIDDGGTGVRVVGGKASRGDAQ